MNSIGQLGLDQLVVAFANDIVEPLKNLISVFCFGAAIVMGLVFCVLMIKRSQDPLRGPGMGAVSMALVLAGVMLGCGNAMGAFGGSFFGAGTTAMQSAAMSYSTGNSTIDTQASAVVKAVLSLGQVIGLMAFIRGWFILNAYANGKPDATQMAGFTHIFGGVFAFYAGNLISHLQNSLHVNIVNFS